MPSSCQQCGTNLKLAPSGRRKRFCSNACRQAAFRNETTAKRASSYPTKGQENPALEPKKHNMIFRYEMRPRAFPIFGSFLERAHIPETKQRELEAH